MGITEVKEKHPEIIAFMVEKHRQLEKTLDKLQKVRNEKVGWM